MKLPAEFGRRAAAGLVAASLALGFATGQATVAPAPQTVHLQPGGQVLVIADTPAPSAAATATPTAATPRPSPTPTSTPVPTPRPSPSLSPAPPTPPITATVVTPSQSIAALLASGKREFLLRAGVHRFSLGSAATTFKNVSMSSYPGEKAVIDGGGAESLVYLGPASGTWTLADLEIRNFVPEDQGVIGIGDAPARLEMTRVKMVGTGVASGNNDHGVYLHGTGTGRLIDPDISGFPGAALQTYRGTPSVEVIGGRLHGLYVGVFAYSGSMTLTRVDIRGAGVWDIDVQAPATATLIDCTGRGADGKPKRTDHS